MLLSRLPRAALFSLLVACTGSLGAASAEFTAKLTEDQQKASGVASLSTEQRTVLDNLVQRELVLANQGNVRAFAGEFSERRSLPERAKAGIDKLTAEQRSQLDTLVAAEIAGRPVQPTSLQAYATSDAVRGVAPKPILHGSVSFTVGTSGGGRNFYGGTVEVEHIDPVKGYSLSIAYSEFHGDGPFWPYWGGPYYGPYSYGPYGRPWMYGRGRW